MPDIPPTSDTNRVDNMAQEDEMVCEISLTPPSNEDIIHVLKDYDKIAVIGLSPKEEKASNRVAKYLQDHDFKIYPVNPMQKEILGETSYPTLLDIPDDIEIVDIFRKPAAVPEIVDQAIEKGAKVIWMQEGIVNNRAADKAREAGLTVIMDRCILKEHVGLNHSEKNNSKD